MKPAPVLMLLAALVASLLVAAPAAQAAETAAKAAATTPSEQDEPSAAERRRESSEFEREKLDGAAFDREEAKSSGGGGSDEGSSDGGGSVMRALLGFVVVLGSIYGIHWLLRKWGQSKLQGVAGTAGVIDVVATTPLAQGRALHLVRVGEELVLVGATEQSITRIGDVDANVLGAQMGGAGKGEFQAMLSGAMLGGQPGVPAGMGGAGSTNEPFIKRFIDNLRMTTAR